SRRKSGAQHRASGKRFECGVHGALTNNLGQRDEAFHSNVLLPVFVGRSSNNAPFLAAALLAEKLLGRDEKYESKLRPIGDAANWKKGVLALKGKPIRVRLDGKPIVSTVQESNSASKTNMEEAQIREVEHAADSTA
ncbi:hypothetical protein AB1A96_20850, partial [Pseudomonas juntendi]|uniref:hypothetical protein n=1 Tax=Pseudomonas juntendi TaxID=2666183 RepID=UPI003456D0E0